MIYNLYVIYDRMSNSCASPIMTDQSDALIQRKVKTTKFNDLIEDNLCDFDLMQIGTLDTEKPQVVGFENAKLICHLENLKYEK